MEAEKLLGRSIFNLSGGEKQKVACASVSAAHPDVFVLDEPTSNLDMDAIESLRRTILLWKSRGKTVVIAEHRLHWLKDICNRVIYMSGGRISLDLPMNEFAALPPEKLRRLGLRPLSLTNLKNESPPAVPGDTLELHVFCCSYDGKKQALDMRSLFCIWKTEWPANSTRLTTAAVNG
ncbi:hypothetical protein A7X67_03745 [Clostridium sp. W14A]|nr:hypothetical protein A7X67_03745 [Clostridium sp. W14A]